MFIVHVYKIIPIITEPNPCVDGNGGCHSLDLCLLSAINPQGFSCVPSEETIPSVTIGMLEKFKYSSTAHSLCSIL